jgi:hypothetical protein
MARIKRKELKSYITMSKPYVLKNMDRLTDKAEMGMS